MANAGLTRNYRLLNMIAVDLLSVVIIVIDTRGIKTKSVAEGPVRIVAIMQPAECRLTIKRLPLKRVLFLFNMSKEKMMGMSTFTCSL